MRVAIPPLPQYAFMAWLSVKRAQGELYLYPPYLEAVSSIRNPRTRLAVVTGTHITWNSRNIKLITSD
jgi:hypothetical protein